MGLKLPARWIAGLRTPGLVKGTGAQETRAVVLDGAKDIFD